MSTEQTEETTALEETAGTDGKQTTEKKKSRASTQAPKVEHFTLNERAARGKAARAEVPRSVARRLGAATTPAGSGGAPRGAGAVPRPGAGSDPLRPHAGLAVHLLPGRRLSWRPTSPAPSNRAAHAALRRRAPVELRRVRFAGASARLRRSTTSTRRCPARSSGTSSGWSRASPSPGATGASTRGPRAESTARSAAATARRSASSRRCAISTSGTRASTSRICEPRSRPARRPSSGSGWRRTSRRRGRRTACRRSGS